MEPESVVQEGDSVIVDERGEKCWFAKAKATGCVQLPTCHASGPILPRMSSLPFDLSEIGYLDLSPLS
jgi:hypothetical protein